MYKLSKSEVSEGENTPREPARQRYGFPWQVIVGTETASVLTGDQNGARHPRQMREPWTPRNGSDRPATHC